MCRKGENIYKRKDGRWEARYIKYHSLDGIAHYGYCYGKNYYEAKNKVIQAKASVIDPLSYPESGKKVRFKTCCEEWLLLKRGSIKESTYVKYEYIIKKHIEPKLGHFYIDTISEPMIEQFSFELQNEEKLSVKTVHDILRLLQSILRYTAKKTPGIRPVDVVCPKEARKERRVLSCEEQNQFVKYLFTNMDECKFGVFLALMTGLRIGEICALKWSDISLKERTLCIQRTMQRLKNIEDEDGEKTKIVISTPKSENSVRIIPLNHTLEEICKKWEVKNPSAYVLTGKDDLFIEPRTLQYRMKQYVKDCGLEGVHFHTLRHSFATRCVEAGFEIKTLSEIMGHSSTGITLECYVHSSMNLKRENMEKLCL